MIDYKYSDLFLESGVYHKLLITIEDTGDTIDNSSIEYECFTLDESLCSDSNLSFGSCEASSVKLTIRNLGYSIKGKTIIITETLSGNTDVSFPFGKYKVYSDMLSSDRTRREIIAYDFLYDITVSDYIEWYNSLEFPVTVKQFRDSFCEYVGIEQVETILPFDDMLIQNDSNVSSNCSGTEILKAVGELNARFAHMNREGKLAWVELPDLDNPEIVLSNGTYKSYAKYESYYTARVSKLQINSTDSSVVFGNSATDKENLYVINDNILLNGMSESQIEEIGDQLLSIYAKYSYRPFSGEFRGNPCYEVGDSIRYYDGDVTIDSYILQRTLTGIQSLTDSYVADGNEFYDNKLNSTKRLVQTEVNKVLNKSGLEIKPFTNKYSLSIQGKTTNAAQIAFKTTDDAVIAFAASIPFTMDLDGIIEAAYYLDDTQLNDIPFRQYCEKGSHILTLFYEFEALKDTTGVFRLMLSTDYVESAIRTNNAQLNGLIQFAQNGGTYAPDDIDTTVPTADIVKGAVKAVIFSSNLVKSKHGVWDGTIDIEEKFTPIIIKSNDITIGSITESLSTKIQTPTASTITEVFNGILLDNSDLAISTGIIEDIISRFVITASSINAENAPLCTYNVDYVACDTAFKLITSYEYSAVEETIDRGRMTVMDMDFTEFASISEISLDGYTPESNTLYLYNEGDECTDVTGGWAGEGTKNTNNLYPYYHDYNKHEYSLYTVYMIDLTKYTKIYIDVNVTSVYNSGTNLFGVSLFVSDVQVTNSNIFNVNPISNVHVNTVGRDIYSLDVSELQGLFYISLIAQLNDNCRGEFYGIWLEK